MKLALFFLIHISFAFSQNSAKQIFVLEKDIAKDQLLDSTLFDYTVGYFDDDFNLADSINGTSRFKVLMYNGIPCYTFANNLCVNEDNGLCFSLRKSRKHNLDEMDSSFFATGFLSGCIKVKILNNLARYYFVDGFLTEVILLNKRETRTKQYFSFLGLYSKNQLQLPCQEFYSRFGEVKLTLNWYYMDGTIKSEMQETSKTPKTPRFYIDYWKQKRQSKVLVQCINDNSENDSIEPVADSRGDYSFKLFPNPTSGILQIGADPAFMLLEDKHMVVYDMGSV